MRRIGLIENEIEKFSNKTKSEKIEFLNNVKDICIHNQKLFISIGEESRKEFTSSIKEKYQFLNQTKLNLSSINLISDSLNFL